MICGEKLCYETLPRPLACHYCGKSEPAVVYCSAGHYVCEDCHGAGYDEFLAYSVSQATTLDSMALAETLLQGPTLPSLGSEHHAIVPASLLTVLRNKGEIHLLNGSRRVVSSEDVTEGIRRAKQLPSCICASHGACGAGLGVGITISILLDSTCAKDVERTMAMRASNAALSAIANCGGPGCCKQSVRTALLVGIELLKELGNIRLPVSRRPCFHIQDTSHGCKGAYCQFSH